MWKKQVRQKNDETQFRYKIREFKNGPLKRLNGTVKRQHGALNHQNTQTMMKHGDHTMFIAKCVNTV
jgi:hypothetical protein